MLIVASCFVPKRMQIYVRDEKSETVKGSDKEKGKVWKKES